MSGSKPKRGEKTRNSGLWTEAKFKSFIKNQLRSATRKWGPIQECKKLARERRGLYRCASCEELVKPTYKAGRVSKANIFVDHIEPIVPVTGWVSWDSCIERMFCELDNLQLVCKDCHDIKSAEETAERKLHRKKK